MITTIDIKIELQIPNAIPIKFPSSVTSSETHVEHCNPTIEISDKPQK